MVIATNTETIIVEIARIFFKKPSLTQRLNNIFNMVIKKDTPGAIKRPKVPVSCDSPTGFP